MKTCWLRWAVIIFALNGLSGCATTPRDKSSSVNDALSQGRILNEAALKSGAKILIIPFSAGEGVVESDELQEISLRLVRGLSEALNAAGDLIVLSGDKAPEADLLIKGRIIRFKEKKGVPRFFKARGVSRYLRVQGEVVQRRGSETVAYFSDETKNIEDAEDFGAMAERLGSRVGHFFSRNP